MPRVIRALLSEEEELHREIIAELMEQADMEVEVSESSAQAIEMIQAKDYDVVVSDLTMPHQTGLHVLRAAKAKNPKTHVVIITGFGTMETLVKAIQEGAYDYITKPFRLEELRLLLKNVHERIDLERANDALAEQLDDARRTMIELSDRNDTLEAQLQEAYQKVQEQESALSDLLKQFPFLVGATAPMEPRKPGEEEPKPPKTETEKKLITKA